MPRETIVYGQRLTDMSLTKEPQSIRTTPSLNLNWDRGDEYVDGGVVAVELEAPRSWIASLQHSELPAETDAVLWVGHLTRSDLNKFIRTLRRARNAAYGGDE